MADFDHNPIGWGSDSKRWRKYPQGVLPLWVADMDFALAEPIRAALARRVAGAPFWYADITSEHNQRVVEYLERCYGWIAEPDWVLWLPGLMVGVYQTVLMNPQGAGVVCQTPVYGPLTRAASLRRAIAAPVRRQGVVWRCDWPQLKPGVADSLLLCHPHNPTGKAMGGDELRQLGDYAARHQLLIISDEIHADLTLDGNHMPFAVACPQLAQSTLTFMAASKTYNIAGLNTAFAIIPNVGLRDQLRARLRLCGEVSGIGLLATLTALAEGESWRRELLGYLRGNRELIRNTLEKIPGLDWLPNQATYLAWLDCSAFASAPGKTDGGERLHQQLLTAGLALSPGSDFGDANFLRLNYATSRDRLQQALDILARCASDLP